ncbi:LysR substrate-binding domain-containing protein [Vibrio fluvialis]|uniref:LysR substrate-binding domain-containing protein n=1 Tax=Vibrio fluvialis TaxID=676 RepID=UPI00215C7F9F|nr:LysR substrate-binding domain-containing protein [Vibrio fluvialis]MCR9301678.1 LysR substrate-binding domain-containing protein [Vibrio fluvialis]
MVNIKSGYRLQLLRQFRSLSIGVCRNAHGQKFASALANLVINELPQVAYEAVEINTAIALVSAGLGCTLVGESISSYQSHGVVFIPVDDLKIKSVVGAIFLADEKGVLVEKFLDCLSLDQE